MVGAELSGSISGSSINGANIVAENFGTGDALGLKSAAAQYFYFSGVKVQVAAQADVWGFDLQHGIVEGTQLEAQVTGLADGTRVYGIRCLGGGISTATLRDVHITALVVDPLMTGIISGIQSIDCPIMVAQSEVSASDITGASYAFYLIANDPMDPYLLRGSYGRGSTSVIRTLGFADVFVVDTQLDGGARICLSKRIF